MKKNLLLLALSLTAAAMVGKAQIQRGNVMVGGDISRFDLSLSESGSFNMGIIPKAAWFIKDNTALGAYVNFTFQTAKGTGSNIGYGVGALARQYMAGDAISAVRHTRFFAEANVGIEGTNDNRTSPKTSTNGLGIGFGPGISYFVTPNIGLEGLLMYKGIIGFGTTATTSRLNLNIGFQVYLPSKNVRSAISNTQ
jgi:hypothetical protein